MPNIWLSIELDQHTEADFKMSDPITTGDPTEIAVRLIDRAAEDAKRWIRAQRGKVAEHD